MKVRINGQGELGTYNIENLNSAEMNMICLSLMTRIQHMSENQNAMPTNFQDRKIKEYKELYKRLVTDWHFQI